MYYYNKKSSRKIVHLKACFRIASSDIDNIGSFETLEEAYANGYRLCRHCSPLAAEYRREANAIAAFSQSNGISTFLDDRSLEIASIYGIWKLVASPDCKRIFLYHKNEFKTAADEKNAVPGYHFQKVWCDSILQYLRYIAEHDVYRMHTPLQMPPRKKEPPKKGTRRYKSAHKRAEKTARKQSVRNVLRLIDSLHLPSQAV